MQGPSPSLKSGHIYIIYTISVTRAIITNGAHDNILGIYPVNVFDEGA